MGTEANGIFSLGWVEDTFDLHFNERPKLKNLQELCRRNWDKGQELSREKDIA